MSQDVLQRRVERIGTKPVRQAYYVDRELHRELKLKAVSLDRGVSDVVREALREWLERQK